MRFGFFSAENAFPNSETCFQFLVITETDPERFGDVFRAFRFRNVSETPERPLTGVSVHHRGGEGRSGGS